LFKNLGASSQKSEEYNLIIKNNSEFWILAPDSCFLDEIWFRVYEKRKFLISFGEYIKKGE